MPINIRFPYEIGSEKSENKLPCLKKNKVTINRYNPHKQKHYWDLNFQ